MTTVGGLLVVMLLTLMTHSANCNIRENYVQDACRVTQYHDLCIHSLASYSNSAKRNPYRWARAAVSVTLGETKRVEQYLIGLRRRKGLRGRDRMALLDCIECFREAINSVDDSLGELRRLEARTFETQMRNVETWTSTALTDDNTCLDGFSGHKNWRVKLLQSRVLNATRITSNALAFVNKLASTGAGSLTSP